MGDSSCLSNDQRRALGRLSQLPVVARFYLAGGSALGVHLGHRRSADLDFFSLGAEADFDALKAAVAGCFDRVEVRAETDAALRLLCDGLPIDFVRYPYPLLDAAGAAFGVGLAGLRDLAAMKLSAIARRGLRRDFWDLFEIIRSGLTLRACGEAYVERFGVKEADLYHVLRALTYFEDAEKDPVFPPGLDEPRWRAIKELFREQAPQLVRPLRDVP
jgi:hypothetical protein